MPGNTSKTPEWPFSLIFKLIVSQNSMVALVTSTSHPILKYFCKERGLGYHDNCFFAPKSQNLASSFLIMDIPGRAWFMNRGNFFCAEIEIQLSVRQARKSKVLVLGCPKIAFFKKNVWKSWFLLDFCSPFSLSAFFWHWKGKCVLWLHSFFRHFLAVFWAISGNWKSKNQ